MQGIFFDGTPEQNYLANIFSEIYLDKLYEPYLSGKSQLTVLDLGAHVGIFSLYASKYASKIYAMEPAKDNFSCLLETIKFNKLENVYPINYALTNINDKRPLFHNSINHTMCSLFSEIATNGDVPEEINTMTIDRLFDENKIEHVDFVKMDIEGCEYEVLAGEGFEKVTPLIDSILLETHSFGGRNENQANEALKNRGFIVEKVKNVPGDQPIILYAHKR